MSRRILVADDNLTHQRLLSTMLQGAGFAVEVASDGKEALKTALAAKFDLIITDQNMPGLTGEQLAALLHRFRPGTPLILLSADAPDPADELPPEFTARYQTPLRKADLLAAVDGALRTP